MEGETAPVGVSDTDFDNLFAEFNVPDTLPEAAMRRAQRHVEESTPKLIELLRQATETARSGKEIEWRPPCIAFYLLWEFKAQEALPAIIDLISLPGELPFDFLGEGVHEDIPLALALLAHDQIDLLDGLIANKNLNEYVRGAVISAYPHLLRDGHIRRDGAVERLRSLLRNTNEQDGLVSTFLAHNLGMFGAKEAADEIQEAYRRGLIDEGFIDWETIEEDLAGGEATLAKTLAQLRPTELDDAVEELRRWPGFQPQEAYSQPTDSLLQQRLEDLVQHYADESLLDESLLNEEEPWESPRAVTSRQVGRNDPCPCGSGKKFKKCCGSRANNLDL